MRKLRINTLIFFSFFFIFINLPKCFAGGIETAVNDIIPEANLNQLKKPEDTIPVIEIRGEGKPMTSSQIRELEELSNGGPLDIKIEKTWVPVDCPRAAKRLDFITFHYKGFSEKGKKFDQSYGTTKNGIRIQLGVGMVMPGLDKGMRGMCDTELRKIKVPYRLSRKYKSKVWKNIPNEEHWMTFNIEMMHVEKWTLELQFEFIDLNNDSFITLNDLVKWVEKMKDFGKTWSNKDIDNVIAARYYIKYFDANKDEKIDLNEFKQIMQRDLATMAASKSSSEVSSNNKKIEGRKRDPGFAWILDFNNDGIVSVEETDSADSVLENDPIILPRFNKEEL